MQINSISDIARQNAVHRPEKTALIFEDESLTYSELDYRSNQVANGLLEFGIEPGERIAYLGKNSHSYFEVLMGIAKAGGVTCPVNWRLAPAEIEYILSDCQTRVLFVDLESLSLVEAIERLPTQIQLMICIEAETSDLFAFEPWRDQYSSHDPKVETGGESAALQLYTSGTTGHPKGAVLSNRALLNAPDRDTNESTPDWIKWTSDDVGLVAMPCFHISGTGVGLTSLFHGAQSVVMRDFDPTKILDLIDAYKVSKLNLVPAVIKMILDQPRVHEVEFSQLDYIIYGGSPIPLELLKRGIEVFGCGFVQNYGMTETCGAIVALPPEDHDPNGNERMHSTGKAMKDVEVEIWDRNSNSLQPRETGEIVVRSKVSMSGYWNLPDATQSTLTDDGWLRTGDAGYLDEDGYLFLQDRINDMIISGGENVYPAEVEHALIAHPKIAEAAAIGVPDDTWGEAVKACIVLKEGEELSEREAIDWARSRIAKYKAPKSIDFIDQMPVNASGKILRRKLRTPYWVGKSRAVN